MNFNSRETYVAAVKVWKQEYKELSETIRQYKLEFRTTESNLDKQTYGDSTMIELRRRHETLRSILRGSKCAANSMLTERAEGKIEAQKQYEIEHSAVEVV